MLARKNVAQIKAYQPGKPIEDVKRELGLTEVIKMASNENPLGPSPKAVAAMRRALTSVNRYPDSQSFYLKRKLAAAIGVDTKNICLGNGSDELIDVVIKTFVEADENVVTADVTFLEYEIIAQVNDRRVKKVPLKNFTYDIEGLIARIDKKTKLVFIANPNNPTGTYLSKGDVRRLVRALPKRTILVLDEAYDTFIDVDDYPQGVTLIERNVIVLKTFSKGYGLAGLRIGYAAAREELIAAMEKVRQPFNVNLLAQAGALAALDDGRFLRRTRATILDGKAYLYKELKALGVRFVPSVTNFILIDVKRDGVRVFQELLQLGIIVRDMKQYGLKNYIRVTIGTEYENKKFISALKRVVR